MDVLIIHQTRRAGLLVGDPVGALHVAGGTLAAVRVDTELVFAAGSGVGRHWNNIKKINDDK